MNRPPLACIERPTTHDRYHPALNIAIAVGINKDDDSDAQGMGRVFCLAYKAVFAVVGNTTVTCAPESSAAAQRGGEGRAWQRRGAGGRRSSGRGI